MLSTNDISSVAQSIGSAIGGAVAEIATTIAFAAIAAFVAYFKKNRNLKAVIDVLVRGVEKSSDRIGEDDTAFVKRSVHTEAVKAGVEQHVDKAVQEVTTKMAEEKTDTQTPPGAR
jgi:hypothetical protein